MAKIADIVGDAASVDLAVRFVLPRDRASSAHDFSTKFGAPEHIAVELLQTSTRLGLCSGADLPSGSQSREPAGLCAAYRGRRTASRRRPASISANSMSAAAFPATYPLSIPAPFEDFFSTIGEAAMSHFGKGTEPELECEPGRGMVATCMSLLTRVKLVCTDGDDIFINDGVYGGLMEFMQVPDLQPPFRVIRDGKELDGPTSPGKSSARPAIRSTCCPTARPARWISGKTTTSSSERWEPMASPPRPLFNGYGDHAVVAVEQVFNG